MVIYRQLARLPTCSIKIDLFVSEISSVSSCEEQKKLHCLFMPLLIITLNDGDDPPHGYVEVLKGHRREKNCLLF